MELKDESDFNSVLKLIREGKNNLVRQANPPTGTLEYIYQRKLKVLNGVKVL